MQTSTACLPCFLRQTRDAARLLGADLLVHERIEPARARELLAVVWREEPGNDEAWYLGARLARDQRQLREARDLIRRLELDPAFLGFAMVAVNNEFWRAQFTAVSSVVVTMPILPSFCSTPIPMLLFSTHKCTQSAE